MFLYCVRCNADWRAFGNTRSDESCVLCETASVCLSVCHINVAVLGATVMGLVALRFAAAACGAAVG